MKMKEMVIKIILILTMAMTVTACGKEKDVDELETVGSAIDIENIKVEIQGFYEENYFVAQKVTIYNFQ